MEKLKILLADDHSLVRAGIKTLLENIQEIEVIAEADNGRQAVNFVREFHPDIVLMDIAMPEMNGLEALEQIKKEFPDVKVIILSMHANEEYVLQAKNKGAVGYLLKDSAPVELEEAIRAVSNGKTFLSPIISKGLIDDYHYRVNHIKKKSGGVFENLTSRKREILQLIAEGNTTKQIAEKLNVSIKTIETHRAQLMETLGIRDIPGLVRYAVRMGIISADK